MKIVVLGAGRERGDPAWESDQPSHLASERLRYAARLAKASGLPLLLTGGLHYGQPPSEAALMAERLVLPGVMISVGFSRVRSCGADPCLCKGMPPDRRSR